MMCRLVRLNLAHPLAAGLRSAKVAQTPGLYLPTLPSTPTSARWTRRFRLAAGSRWRSMRTLARWTVPSGPSGTRACRAASRTARGFSGKTVAACCARRLHAFRTRALSQPVAQAVGATLRMRQKPHPFAGRTVGPSTRRWPRCGKTHCACVGAPSACGSKARRAAPASRCGGRPARRFVSSLCTAGKKWSDCGTSGPRAGRKAGAFVISALRSSATARPCGQGLARAGRTPASPRLAEAGTSSRRSRGTCATTPPTWASCNSASTRLHSACSRSGVAMAAVVAINRQPPSRCGGAGATSC